MKLLIRMQHTDTVSTWECTRHWLLRSILTFPQKQLNICICKQKRMYTKLSSVSCRLVLSANLESLSQTNLWYTQSFDSKMIKSRAGLQKFAHLPTQSSPLVYGICSWLTWARAWRWRRSRSSAARACGARTGRNQRTKRTGLRFRLNAIEMEHCQVFCLKSALNEDYIKIKMSEFRLGHVGILTKSCAVLITPEVCVIKTIFSTNKYFLSVWYESWYAFNLLQKHDIIQAISPCPRLTTINTL